MLNNNTKIPVMLSISRAAKESGLSAFELRRLCTSGSLDHVRVGARNRKIMINENSLIRYLTKSTDDKKD